MADSTIHVRACARGCGQALPLSARSGTFGSSVSFSPRVPPHPFPYPPLPPRRPLGLQPQRHSGFLMQISPRPSPLLCLAGACRGCPSTSPQSITFVYLFVPEGKRQSDCPALDRCQTGPKQAPIPSDMGLVLAWLQCLGSHGACRRLGSEGVSHLCNPKRIAGSAALGSTRVMAYAGHCGGQL